MHRVDVYDKKLLILSHEGSVHLGRLKSSTWVFKYDIGEALIQGGCLCLKVPRCTHIQIFIFIFHPELN